MKLLKQPEQLSALGVPVMLASGFFDGVHLGHQAVLGETVRRARETGGQAWALTFDRHPLEVILPAKAPPLLMPLAERLARLEALGIDGVLLLHFTRRMALQEPETFVRWLCCVPAAGTPPPAALSEVRCGQNWRFGRRAAGTPEMLAEYGKTYGFRVVIVPYAQYQGEEISSTRIRLAVQEGRLDDARAMLGRPYSVSGLVQKGCRRGAGLGFATANIPSAAVMPPEGVYAVRARIDGGAEVAGVANWGANPTFHAAEKTLETHLIGTGGCGELYGRKLDVSFLAHLRDERAFATPSALAAQIARDVEQANHLFQKEFVNHV